MPGTVEFSKRGAIGLMTVKNPPVNALSADVRDGLMAAFKVAMADAEVKAMVIVGDERTFIAGADIREFGKPPAGTPLAEVNATFEASSKPIIAGIHGTALGGGLEVALVCHYRVAVAKAIVGLPEVKLGLIPGAGGTQRLPRLTGAQTALDMIVNGSFIPAPKAKEWGIVDAIVDDHVDGAVAFAAHIVGENKPPRKVRDIALEPAPELFEKYRKTIARKARGFVAPWKCIDAVEAATSLDFDAGLKRERELFRICHDSPESAAQRHVFFAEREINKIPDVPKTTAVKEIKTAAIIGAGTMGGGIAMNFANAGIPVTILEADGEALQRGIDTIQRNYANTVAKGRLSQQAMDTRMALIQPSTDYAAISDVDLVIEAVFEDMAVKKEVFAKLDAAVNAEAILATNTSTLDIDEIAGATSRPAQVIGMHFFSPANVMRLLEVVRGRASSAATIATAMAIGRKIGKISVLVGNCDGFVGNRMLHCYTREAAFLLEEGALPQDVDRVIFDFGLPMGPFAMGDLAGLDIGWRIRKRKRAQYPSNQRYPGTIADQICEMGRFGQKTGGGYYDYQDGSRVPVPNAEIEALIRQTSEQLGITRRDIHDEEILKRCMYPLINEGAKILAEGIALRPSDIDIIYINGYGFPAYRGGPMFYADSLGLDKVLADIKALHNAHGDTWAPAPLLAELAMSGQSFSQWAKNRG